MKNKITLIISFTMLVLSLSSTHVFGQKQSVADKLKALGLPSDFFEQTDDKVNYSFIGITTTEGSSANTTPTSKKVTFSYKPNQAEQKYTLISINDTTPTEKEISDFDKNHNNKNDNGKMGKPDPESFTILKEDENEMIIGFKYLPKSLPHKYKFLADCTGQFFINKSDKHVTKIKFFSDKEIKYKIFKIEKLDMTQNLKYMPETQSYIISNETVYLEIKLFGQIVSNKETTEYNQYKIINK